MSEQAVRLSELEERNAWLEEQLALHRDALEHMHQGLCMFDAEGRITLLNRRYSEILQVPAGSLRPGMTSTDLIELGIEAGHYPAGKTVEEIRTDIRKQLRSSSYPFGTMSRGDKTYAIKIRDTDQGLSVTTCEDITDLVEVQSALRDSEARLKAIFDAMPDCVKIFDESARLIHINPRGLELLQAPDLPSLSTPGYIPVPPEYLDSCLDVHRRVMAGESVVWTYEVIGLLGRRRHVEAHAVPFRMPDGSRVHMCISRDVNERQQTLDALVHSEERLRLVQEATGLADFETKPGMISRMSEYFVKQAGLPAGTKSLSAAEWMEIVHPADRELFGQMIKETVYRVDTVQCEYRIVRPDNGEVRWIYSRTKRHRDTSGKTVSSIGAHLDITERKLAEEALRESEERFRLAAEAAGLGVWDYDASLHKREWSERLREIFGLGEGVQPGFAAAEKCVHPGDQAKFREQVEALRSGQASRFEESFRIRRASDRAERWITINGWRTSKADQGLRRIIMTVRDVTEEKTAEERVRWSASHDALTRLANRSLFQEKLDTAIQRAAVSGRAVGLLLLDMDHFKQINDSLGHDVGDMLLKMFAKRLRGVVRHCDTVARFGGDEFAVVMPELDGEHALLHIARAIQQRLREPFIHTGRIIDCRVSIGASFFPEHGATPDALLKNADLALYAAKAAGRGIVKVFEPQMGEDVKRRNSMVDLARNALSSDRVIPYYQPKLDLATGALVGFEALLRWRMPNGRIGHPAALEAAFEDAEVAAQISDRMIDRVIKDIRSWLDRGVDFRHVAVNASAAEFRRDNFAERLLEQLQRADIPTRCFQLEVTETVFLGRGAEYVHRALALLSLRGIKIALDDFGTGYASLRHLKQFPVDTIKIDQSFVRDMMEDPGDEAIIRAVINLGRSLGIKVVAEGIESQGQARRLIELACDFGQGFLFSRAVPAGRVPTMVSGCFLQPAVPAAAIRGRDLRLVANRD
jgi:diguanylate cyclase (GGDEF)-like protein/PAS domain S-box-containing protein